MTREQDDFEKETEALEQDGHNSTEYDDFIFTTYHKKKKKRRHRHRRHHHHHSSSGGSSHQLVRKGSSHEKREKSWWQKLLIIMGIVLGSILVLGIITVGVFFLLKEAGIYQLTNNEIYMTAPKIENADVSVNNSENTITYKGKTYVYNKSMTSILCMGIDKRDGFGLEDETVGTGGQADALYLIAMDTATGKTDIIGVARDIYTDIEVYSTGGHYMGTQNAQLCLAYAYGDGKETSCENTVNAVQRLFYNLPVNSYIAVELDAIAELNDAVGGVTVTLKDDFYYFNSLLGYKGDTITLYGDEARAFLQYRDVSELESGVDRMNRQLQYLESFTQTAIEMTKKDLSTPVTLFNIATDYSVTNLNASKISALAYTVVTSNAAVDFKKVPGEVVKNGEYAEYVVDKQGMLELILDVYYTPVK